MIRASILKWLSLLFYRVSFSRMSQGGGGRQNILPAGMREFSGNVIEKHGMREFSKKYL